MSGRFYAVIPAGGSGTRLWPLSRAARPKFLLPLPGPLTMLQATVERLGPLVAPADMLLVTGAAHAIEAARQLPGLTPEQFVIEPAARGSGPAIALATAIVARRDPDAVVGSFAADHVVQHPERFVAAVRAACQVAQEGFLVTIGIAPTYPETGYGYIQQGQPLGSYAGQPAYQVARFQEKPDHATATRYVQEGGYLWNASMFVWRAATLLAELRRLLPDLAAAVEELAGVWGTTAWEGRLAEMWPTLQDVTIDQGVLERTDRVAVVPADLGWSDLGDWHGVGTVVGGGQTPNVTWGADVLALDADNAVVVGNGRLVALVGVDNVVVVDTDDALLVCERSRAQEVRRLVEELKQRGARHLV